MAYCGIYGMNIMVWVIDWYALNHRNADCIEALIKKQNKGGQTFVLCKLAQ